MAINYKLNTRDREPTMYCPALIVEWNLDFFEMNGIVKIQEAFLQCQKEQSILTDVSKSTSVSH